MVLFWGTAVSTSAARLAALWIIEPYAMAVHEQLVYNFAFHGDFFQTVHRGYDDAWTWSGHRAITLVISALLYKLSPTALWLTSIQIGAVMLGAIPAGLLGQRALRSGWGYLVGGLLYLLTPAVMAIALQDYQDLVFALPALVFAMWAFGARGWWWPIIGALVAILPREESIFAMVAVAGLTIPPGWRLKRYAWNVAVAVVVGGVYSALVAWLFPIGFAGGAGDNHDMPLVNAIGEAANGLMTWTLPGLQWPQFYQFAFAPFGALILLAPGRALPGLGLVLLHLTVPYGHGVDRSWFGHAHHMTLATAFLVVAGIESTCLLMRLAAGWTRDDGEPSRLDWRTRVERWPKVKWLGPIVAAAIGIGVLNYAQGWMKSWATSFNLVVAWTPQEPASRHPVWELVDMLPEDAVPISFLEASIAISSRTESYTFEESLSDKAPGRGLGAGTHLITDTRQEKVVAWGMAMPGAEVVETIGNYALITWTPGAKDPTPRGPEKLAHRLRWIPPGNGHPAGVPKARGEVMP